MKLEFILGPSMVFDLCDHLRRFASRLGWPKDGGRRVPQELGGSFDYIERGAVGA